MMRSLIPACAAALVLAASPVAEASDCIQTCGDVCYAGEDASFHRVEVVGASGADLRVRFLERLGGNPAVGPAVGEERDGVYPVEQVEPGVELFVSVTKYSDSDREYVGNAWRISEGNIICSEADPAVSLAEYVAMATSDRCEAIADELAIANTCSDVNASPGCAQAGSGSIGWLAGVLFGLAAVVRRRRSDVSDRRA